MESGPRTALGLAKIPYFRLAGIGGVLACLGTRTSRTLENNPGVGARHPDLDSRQTQLYVPRLDPMSFSGLLP